ncbi:unnamed protein product [Arctogadus glacialis]
MCCVFRDPWVHHGISLITAVKCRWRRTTGARGWVLIIKDTERLGVTAVVLLTKGVQSAEKDPTLKERN